MNQIRNLIQLRAGSEHNKHVKLVMKRWWGNVLLLYVWIRTIYGSGNISTLMIIICLIFWMAFIILEYNIIKWQVVE